MTGCRRLPAIEVSRERVGVNMIAIADIAASPGAIRNGVYMRAVTARRIAFEMPMMPSLPSGLTREPQKQIAMLRRINIEIARTQGEPCGAIHHTIGMNAKNDTYA